MTTRLKPTTTVGRGEACAFKFSNEDGFCVHRDIEFVGWKNGDLSICVAEHCYQFDHESRSSNLIHIPKKDIPKFLAALRLLVAQMDYNNLS